jgi:hypothetical protein
MSEEFQKACEGVKLVVAHEQGLESVSQTVKK